MANIQIKNLTFSYNNYTKKIFDNVNMSFDTNWKIGLIGRNGIGKSTLFKILLNELEYEGNIIHNQNFQKFPLGINNYNKTAIEIFENFNISYNLWELYKEINLLNLNEDVLEKKFYSLSKGEQTKIELAILFTLPEKFLLIDEPTNHLDLKGREIVAKYLNSKNGFILISHDRNFLDNCINHIISINKSTIDIQRCNFSTWEENKKREDNFELEQNYKLKKDIKRLKQSSLQKRVWADKIEKSKIGCKGDKGSIGKKAAKMMQLAKNLERRQLKSINDKEKLLKNIEEIRKLKLENLEHHKDKLIKIENLEYKINNNIILKNINFELFQKDRLCIIGNNGSGKSTLIKIILNQINDYTGNFYIANEIIFSYISQISTNLKGNLKDFINKNYIDETLFKSILAKLNFSKEHFELNLENYSEGQKKKVLIASSLSTKAHIFIWDEPLNYIDVLSRIQIEELILEYNPTLIFVEHDRNFIENIATKFLYL